MHDKIIKGLFQYDYSQRTRRYRVSSFMSSHIGFRPLIYSNLANNILQPTTYMRSNPPHTHRTYVVVVPNSGNLNPNSKPIPRNCDAYFPNFVQGKVYAKFSWFWSREHIQTYP